MIKGDTKKKPRKQPRNKGNNFLYEIDWFMGTSPSKSVPP
jgi:hypothetical protein